MAKGKEKTTVHKHVREAGRAGGKSFKQYPKGFSAVKRRLVTVHLPEEGGTKVDY